MKNQRRVRSHGDNECLANPRVLSGGEVALIANWGGQEGF